MTRPAPFFQHVPRSFHGEFSAAGSLPGPLSCRLNLFGAVPDAHPRASRDAGLPGLSVLHLWRLPELPGLSAGWRAAAPGHRAGGQVPAGACAFLPAATHSPGKVHRFPRAWPCSSCGRKPVVRGRGATARPCRARGPSRQPSPSPLAPTRSTPALVSGPVPGRLAKASKPLAAGHFPGWGEGGGAGPEGWGGRTKAPEVLPAERRR